DEFVTFAGRLAHDNAARFFSQVHTTTPGWTFTYFIEQLGWGFFPSVALIPGAAAALAHVDRQKAHPAARATLPLGRRAMSVFIFFSFSGTKFHHYIFPVLPALSFCVALFIDRLWREGIDRWSITLYGALGLFALVGQGLYVWHEDAGPHSGLKHWTDLF